MMEMHEERLAFLGKSGVLWRHSGNLDRPFARLTSGKISDTFFNAGMLVEYPTLLSRVAQFLVEDFPRKKLGEFVICGLPYGSLFLAYEMARLANCKFIHLEKDDDQFCCKRFGVQGKQVLLVEDVITTGGSIEKAHHLIESLGGYPTNVVPCIVDRTGKRTCGLFSLFSFVKISPKVWNEGENPYTSDGEEVIPPLRPKENWVQFTQ